MYFRSNKLRINSPTDVPLSLVSLCFEMIEGRGVEMKKLVLIYARLSQKISRMKCHQSSLSMYVSVVLSWQDHMDQTGILVWQWEARETIWGSLFDMAVPECAT